MPVKLSPSSNDHEEEARIEIVPLIDIMFFLLASFMMVSLSMTNMSRIKVNLPKAAHASAEKKTPPVHIAIDAFGVASWDKATVTPSDITARLLEMQAKDADLRVMIAADEEAKQKQIVPILDAIKAANIEKIAIETKQP